VTEARTTTSSRSADEGLESAKTSSLPPESGSVPVAPPQSERDFLSQDLLESRIREGMLELLDPITLVVGLLYIPVALSHLTLLPGAGRLPMFVLAMSFSVALIFAHRWIKLHPTHLRAVPLITSLIYVAIIVHSLMRLTYARGPGDMLFVGVLAVAMGLLPATLWFHGLAVLAYLAGWSAIIVIHEGVAAWTPYVSSLIMIATVSVVIRYLELGRTRRVHELVLIDATREAELLFSEAKLRHEVHHDALTGMPNRVAITRRLAECFEAARRGDGPEFALLHLNLNRFKVVNDSLGHDFGDRLLQALALRLFRCIQPGDTVGRLGADEFAVLLVSIEHRDEVVEVAEHLHTVFDEPFVIDDYEVRLAASIGIAIYEPEYADADAMLRDAGIALAEAKATSAKHRVFASDMHERALDRLQTEVDLRGAVDREELVVFYQPLVDLVSGEVLGFEALVRWRHPVRGMLMPVAFLRLAEETGLIQLLGAWVLRTACRDLAEWDPEGELFLSVNVSPKQFARVDFESMVESALSETGLAPERLWLELTETAVLDQPDVAKGRIQRLHELGISVVVDDFGSGYSSLSYLQRYPFRVLKLDRMFVAPERQHDHILQAIIHLGHALDMRVVAEGVEQASQIRTLRQLGCNIGQGHLLSRPIPGERARELKRIDLSSLAVSGDGADDATPAASA
jgi:diguanylate cyclase (GGDEF)-like protein